jgi:hypothetical protein
MQSVSLVLEQRVIWSLILSFGAMDLPSSLHHPFFLFSSHFVGKYCPRNLAAEEGVQTEMIQAASCTPAQIFCNINI